MECLTKIKTHVTKDSLPSCVELCKQAEYARTSTCSRRVQTVCWFDGDNVRTAIHYPFDWGLLNAYAVYSNGWAAYQIADDMRGNRKSRNYNMEKGGWTEWINL